MLQEKEAGARIKINKLLEDSGWRFTDDENGRANICLEPGIKYTELGDDFEHTKHGFIDFLLLDLDGKPLVVVEAKRASVEPLTAKEQARNYARNIGARFVILSNGNLHYLWDTKHGNPDTISKFPTQESISQYVKYIPNPLELGNTFVDENYIAESQMPDLSKDPAYIDEGLRVEFLRAHHLKQLRPYQLQAVKSLQSSAKKGNQRFLFEMATGTGKTLVSAAVIKLFLKSGNARRVLFLVDRIELENQAYKAFKNYLGKDYGVVVYKDNRDSWQNANIVVSTIQTFLVGDRYKKEFSPTDFEFVISDEAHRSIGGNSRAVFEYFVGYKLGLTATPKDYLKGFDKEEMNTQREFERRVLMDTYKTFGCESGEPTFRYDLVKGVEEGYLINPIIVDARTEITTDLLSDQGYAVHITTPEGEDIDQVFNEKHYERKFFNEETNIAMCKALFDNGLYDPVVKRLGQDLFGKTIVFCVSQRHAARITNILNRLAYEKWPDLYDESDFAVQVTSLVNGAQQMTINFANNMLGGKTKRPDGYDSSKTRVAVTVGMMTTGYDCEDILNIALMRPVFSPSDFVQIKGRGTRKYLFEYIDYLNNDKIISQKEHFKFFDFFATCEYFEKEFNYDEKIKVPNIQKVKTIITDGEEGGIDDVYVDEEGKKIFKGPVDIATHDEITSVLETAVDENGMRIDREGFRRAIEEDVLSDDNLNVLWKNGDEAEAEEYTKQYILNRPKHYLNLEKIRQIFNVDRRINIKEFLQVAFGEKDSFEMKDDLLESEWEKFLEVNEIDQAHYRVAKTFFKGYIVDSELRDIIDSKKYAELNFNPSLNFQEYQKLNGLKEQIPVYIKDYVPLNTYID